MHPVLTVATLRKWCALTILLAGALATGATEVSVTGKSPLGLLTNLFQLRQQADQEVYVLHPFQIVAEVMATDESKSVVVLRDHSGVEFIKIKFGNREIAPGDTVRLEGRGCAVMREGFGLVIVPGFVVDNDGIHAAATESGRIFLPAGMHPMRLEWFNRFGEVILGVEWEGPGLPRQPIPDAALFRTVVERNTGRTNYLPGLDYRCYQGEWEVLPGFADLPPKKTGIVANFDINVRTQHDNVGVEFLGGLKIPQDGVYTFHVNSDDGSRLWVGTATGDFQVVRKEADNESGPPLELTESSRQWVTLEGAVASVGAWTGGGELWMRGGDGDVRVEVFDGSGIESDFPRRGRIRATGIYEKVLSEEGARVPGRLLVLNWQSVQPPPSGVSAVKPAERVGGARAAADSLGSGTNETPVLTTAAEVKALSPELAQQRLPVSLRGVLTDAKRPFAVLQDSSRGVYVDLGQVQAGKPLRRGEYCQVDGVTGPGLFAPIVLAQRVTRLGVGQMPTPVRATWVQLMNGGLDTEFAELDGVVTAVENRRLMLLTQGGKIAVELTDFRTEVLPSYADALIRVRGCFFANFNMTTRKFEAGSVSVGGAMLEVLSPAPPHLFDVPNRSLGELLFYDPKAAPFRHLKISGQVIHHRGDEYFLTDGTNGVKVTSRARQDFQIGEIVEAVGFLELGSRVAKLKEAVMRKTGSAPLPAPVKLPSAELLLARHAGTLVQTEATLINDWREGAEYVLELQSGFLAFKARLSELRSSFAVPPPGSQLAVTGVYAPQGAENLDGTVSGLELWLSGPEGIHVLSTPPWWNLRRVLVLAGILAALLLGVLAWNKQLQRKVQSRGRQLEIEIRNRQRAEMEHATEAERARIARDLHDELGTALTEVSLLSSASLGDGEGGMKYQERFRVIAEKARDLVANLDVIVWAVNPKHNSLQSLADYLESYTRELLSASGMVYRCRIPIDCGSVALGGAARHSLLLAIKESLNNVIRHAAATEVELEMRHGGDHLEIVIADNGRGFDWSEVRRRSGLTNIQERMENLGGACHIESRPGKGTQVQLSVPLPSAEQDKARN